jgi:SAM-dependent methyltransferase
MVALKRLKSLSLKGIFRQQISRAFIGEEPAIHPNEYPAAVEIIVPLVIELLRPGSVVDFGCNVGLWLEGFSRRGVTDILGIDKGGTWTERLRFPTDKFLDCDLDNVRTLNLKRTFDLALCLECAEHLEPEAAPFLVRALCRSAPHVLFSAALPGQTGCGHKNEQYPDYWMRLFRESGFEMFDCFRRRIWNDPKVEFWYKQNMYLFSTEPDAFTISIPKWDGSVYIAPELFELYAKHGDLETSSPNRFSSRTKHLMKKISYLVRPTQ